MVGAQIYPTKILAALHLVGYQNFGYVWHLPTQLNSDVAYLKKKKKTQMLPVFGDLQPIVGKILAFIWFATKILVAYGILHNCSLFLNVAKILANRGSSQTCPSPYQKYLLKWVLHLEKWYSHGI